MAKLLVEDKKLVRFLLDSGTTTNVLPYSIYKEIKRKCGPLRPSSKKLVAFNKSEMIVAGEIKLEVENIKNKKKYHVKFVVAKAECKPVLGFQTVQKMEFITVHTENVATVSLQEDVSVKRISKEYNDIFEGEGTLKGKLHLEIDPLAPPVKLPCRKWPLAVMNKVKDELNRLQKLNVICYKKYTLPKTLGKLDISTTSNEGTKDGLAAAPVRSLRSSSTPRPRSSPQCDIYKTQCAVCGFAKHHGIYDKYRISETNRAQKFLEATVFLQDDIYTRSCDLQDVNGVFGADLYCHKYCINRYIQLYGRRKTKTDKETPISSKLQAWSKVIKDIDIGLNKGEGYELSHIRDSINKHLDPDGSVRDKKVKVLLVNHFGDKIGFFQSKQVTKSAMCFGKSVSTEHLVNTIRATDPIRESAELIMQSLKEVDFDLEDRSHCVVQERTNSCHPRFFGTYANVQDMDLVIIRTEEYLVHVLKKGTAFTTMNQLRTHTYHQSKGAYLDKLPPTSYDIKAHIRRAF
ncbi:hypothetical protein GQR58_024757 [Nymphon striatum]|nr:hypothetical protein GQR58_024757 [Nymphon striatum]